MAAKKKAGAKKTGAKKTKTTKKAAGKTAIPGAGNCVDGIDLTPSTSTAPVDHVECVSDGGAKDFFLRSPSALRDARSGLQKRRGATPESNQILESIPNALAHRHFRCETNKSRGLVGPRVDCGVERLDPVGAPERLLSLISRQVFLFDT